MSFWDKTVEIPHAESALPGRSEPSYYVPDVHHVNGNTLQGPFPKESEVVYVAMGCFWGAERFFWRLDGVYSTAVGYQGGSTPFPTYQETCTGKTGHTEAVQVVYFPEEVALSEVLKVFWEEHDPTQGMRQGNDVGSQYRSAIYTTSAEQLEEVLESKTMFEEGLAAAGLAPITTEIGLADTFYYAEEHHQQYLAKNPAGYCGLKGTGVTCTI